MLVTIGARNYPNGGELVVGAPLRVGESRLEEGKAEREVLHSAKGGAVETGCSGLHSIIGDFTI